MRTLLTLAFLLLAQAAFAQTGTVAWTQNDVVSAAQAQSFTQALSVTPFGATAPNAAVQLTGITCTFIANIASCTAPLPAAASQALITGSKSTLETTDPSTGLRSGPSAPFAPGPSVPAALRVSKP